MKTLSILIGLGCILFAVPCINFGFVTQDIISAVFALFGIILVAFGVKLIYLVCKHK